MAIYEFGCFSLNVAERSLSRRGRPLKLTQRLFNILTILVQNNERVVTKEELIQSIWPETIVEESNLTVAISRLRTLLGDDSQRRKYIITLPRSGYRFVGDVRRIENGSGNSIAVLPFAHPASRPDSEDIADGMTESLIYSLSRLPHVKVVPRSSILRYKGKRVDPAKVANTLGVSALVSGRIMWHGEDLTISVELLGGGGCKELVWGNQYRRKTSDFMATQRDIVSKMIDVLNRKMGTGAYQRDPSLQSLPPNNDVYELYLRGRFHWDKRSEGHLHKSIDYFKKAITQDPNFGLAYAGLADSYNMLGFLSMMEPKIAFARAKAAASRALALEHSGSDAHASIGFSTFYYEWDWKEAESTFKESLKRDPNCPSARFYYGCFLIAAGRFDEAITQYEIALKVEPLSLIANAALGYGYYFARRYNEAIAQCRAVTEMDEHFEAAHVWLGWAYEQTGLLNEAISEYEKALNLSGRRTSILATWGAALALAKREAEGQAVLEELAHRSTHMFVSAYQIACIYAARDEKDKAFEYLERAYRDRCHLLVNLQVDPKLDTLRSDQRFCDLVQRVVPAQYNAQRGEAYRTYRIGRYFFSYHTREGLEQALDHFQRASKLDSQYVPAYAAMVDCYLRLSTNYFQPTDQDPPQSAPINDPPPMKQAALELRRKWEAATVAQEVKRASEVGFAVPDARLWNAACVFARSLYENRLRNLQNECKSRSEVQRHSNSSELAVHLQPISISEEVQIACLVTRGQIEVGNTEAGYLMLHRWYRLGEWPRLEGLNPQLSAYLLLTAGMLAGRFASARLLPRGQKHAEALLNGAISLFEQVGLKPRVAEARSELGRCYDREGMFELARSQFLEALEELPSDYPELISKTLLRLAFAEMKVGHLHDALKRLDDAREVVAAAGLLTSDFFNIEMATTIGELAIAEQSESDFHQACLHYQQALSNSATVGHHRRTGVLENNHGHLLIAFGKLQEAEAALTRAKKLFDHLGDPCPQLDETLARLHLEAGRLELAEETILPSIGKLQTAGEEALLAESLRTHGRILCKSGRIREAKRVLDRAYEIAQGCGDREGAGLAVLITIEEISEQLQHDERLELMAVLRGQLGHSERTSVLDRLQKCEEILYRKTDRRKKSEKPGDLRDS